MSAVSAARARSRGSGGVDERSSVAGPAERAAAGRALRRAVPRSSHAELPSPRQDRDAVALLASQAATRVPDLIPLRYARMGVSPFTFYRGAALVMADDLAATPATGITTQLCGDAHLANFGLFGSPERRLVFDINDFDETFPGPWEWDVKRLAASVELAGRDNGHTDKQRRKAVEACVAAYRASMAELARTTTLDAWYAHLSADDLTTWFGSRIPRSRREEVSRAVAKAYTRSNLGALGRFVEERDGAPVLRAEPPLVVPLRELVAEGTESKDVPKRLRGLLADYRTTLDPDRRVLLDRFRLVDVARKVVGVGSVGTRCWMLLLLGDGLNDPLFLQAKEAGASVLERYVQHPAPDNEGRRVVEGQRLMQAVGDIFLGWVRVAGFDGATRDFYVRQLRDWKGSAEVDRLLPAGMKAYGELCGRTLARAHARSGDRIMIDGYLGCGPAFDVAVAAFARTYADRTAEDHASLVQAVTSGRLPSAVPE